MVMKQALLVTLLHTLLYVENKSPSPDPNSTVIAELGRLRVVEYVVFICFLHLKFHIWLRSHWQKADIISVCVQKTWSVDG